MSDIVERLMDACNGHPHAKIPWPHRLLHEAADEIVSLRARLERAGERISDCEKAISLMNIAPWRQYCDSLEGDFIGSVMQGIGQFERELENGGGDG